MLQNRSFWGQGDRIRSVSAGTQTEKPTQKAALTFEEEDLLCRRIQRGDTEALETLIAAKKGLIAAIAIRLFPRANGLTVEDLIQEGSIGLITAAKKFKPSLKCRFNTIAVWWIRQGMVRAILKDNQITMPLHISQQSRKIFALADTLLQHLGRPPTTEEIARESGCPLKTVKKISAAKPFVLSMESLIEDREWWSKLQTARQDFTALNADQIINLLAIRQILFDDVKLLNRQEKTVIILRFGLDSENGRSRSLEEVGKNMRLSRERIRQIEANAIKKMKRYLCEETPDLPL